MCFDCNVASDIHDCQICQNGQRGEYDSVYCEYCSMELCNKCTYNMTLCDVGDGEMTLRTVCLKKYCYMCNLVKYLKRINLNKNDLNKVIDFYIEQRVCKLILKGEEEPCSFYEDIDYYDTTIDYSKCYKFKKYKELFN